MAHGTNIISSIDLGTSRGGKFEIHDAQAVHTLADLAALGMDTSNIFVFKGTVATTADLPTTGNKVGYVYHVTANHSEYIWAKVDDGTAEGWEEFGEHFVVNHKHSVDAQTVSYTPSITTAKTGIVAGAPSLTTEKTSVLTGLGTATTANAITAFNAPTTSAVISVSASTTAKALTGVSTTTASVVSSVSATSTTSVVTGLTTSQTNVMSAVDTGVASAVTGLTTAKGTAVTGVSTTSASAVGIKSVASVGTASSWNFSVSNGVLTISGANSTVPTTSDVTASKIGSDGKGTYATGQSGTTTVMTSVTASGTDDFVTNVTPTTVSVTATATASGTGTAVTGITTGKTNVVSAVGSSGTADAIIAIGTTTASFVTGVTTKTTAKAVTGYTSPATTSVLTSVSASAPAITTGTNANATVLTSVTANAKNLTIPAHTTNGPQE